MTSPDKRGYLEVGRVEQISLEQKKKAAKPALFGTNFHGEECWFCWRLALRDGAGCRGILATYAHTITALPNGETLPYLRLPEKWVRLRNGIIGQHTRPRFRCENVAWALKEARKYRQWEKFAENDDEREKMGRLAAHCEEIAEEETKTENHAVIPSRLFRGSSDDGFERDPFPAIIACPSCNALSIVPSLRGPIAVKSGSVIK